MPLSEHFMNSDGRTDGQIPTKSNVKCLMALVRFHLTFIPYFCGILTLN